MKNKVKKQKVVSILLALSLLVSMLTTTSAAAYEQIPENEYATQGIAGPIAVFVLGILTGYVVDGAFIYATGHSAGELSAIAIERIIILATRSGGTTIEVDENGNAWSGTSGKFSLVPTP